MKKFFRRCGILLIFSSLPFFACKTEMSEQHIPISVWYGPTLKTVNPVDFLTIRDAGFTNCYIDLQDSELNQRALSFADSIGIGLFVTDSHIDRFKAGRDSTLYIIDSLTTLYSSFNSFSGYFLSDKPGLDDLAPLSVLTDYLHSRFPAHTFFINAFPEYAVPALLDTSVYADYLSVLSRNLRPKFLSYEHFGIIRNQIRPEFFSNLEAARQNALKHDVPFWSYALLVAFDNHPVVAHSHVRFQLYSGLAYGAKGVHYYSFRPPKNNSYEYGDAMLSVEGDHTDALSFCRLINSELHKIGPTLMRLTSTGVYFSNPVPPQGSAFTPGLPIIKIDSPSILAGFFVNEFGEKYVLFVNTDFSYGKRARIHFSEEVLSLVEISKNYMPPLVIEWEDEIYKDADILFKAGDGRLFKIIE